MRSSKNTNLEKTLEKLEIDILSGVFRPRERLVERELVERYGVGRGTIRRVLAELELRHLVRHYSNRGAAVAEPSRKEMEDIYATRLVLEDFALDTVIGKIDSKTLNRAVSYARAFENAAKEKKLRQMVASNRLFHQTILESCGNSVVAELIDELRKRSHMWQHYIVGYPGRIRKTIAEHRAMIYWIRRKDEAQLKQINRNHLTAGYKSFMEDLMQPRDQKP